MELCKVMKMKITHDYIVFGFLSLFVSVGETRNADVTHFPSLLNFFFYSCVFKLNVLLLL